MTKPLREVIHGSATLLKIAEKPLGIGLSIGLTVGYANSVILGIPLWFSLSGGDWRDSRASQLNWGHQRGRHAQVLLLPGAATPCRMIAYKWP